MFEKALLLEYIKNLPTILIIDDDYGGIEDSKRINFCESTGLIDITNKDEFYEQDIEFDVFEETNTGGRLTLNGVQKFDYIPVAKAKFISGQIKKNDEIFNDLLEVLNEIKKGWVNSVKWNLIFLDLHFEESHKEKESELYNNKNEFGLKILSKLNDEKLDDIPIIIVSGKNRDEFESEFVKYDLRKFISRTDLRKRHQIVELLFNYGMVEDNPSLNFLFERYFMLDNSKRENNLVSWNNLETSLNNYSNDNDIRFIIGKSKSLLKCLKEARKRSRIENGLGGDNILLLSESGTGKELLAKYIHRMSGRRGKYQVVFTQGIADTLLEDSVFGHVKGAFTGANEDLPGAAEIANNGTLFIDEFGEIPLKLQSKFLRLLDKDTRETVRMGSINVCKVNIIVVLATNRMEILGDGGNFRTDLLARIDIMNPIILPNLSKRKEDIEILVNYFVRKYERIFKANERKISKDSINYLKEQVWKYNIRGLEQIIMRAIYEFSDSKILSKNHFRFFVKNDNNYNNEEFKVIDKPIVDMPLSSVTLRELSNAFLELNSSNISDNIGNAINLESIETNNQNNSRENKDAILEIEDLIETMQSFEFNNIQEDEYKGLLIKLDESYRIMIFNLLKTLFKRESKFSARRDFILPAPEKIVKLLLNNNKITQSIPIRLLQNQLYDSKYFSTKVIEKINEDLFGKLFLKILNKEIKNTISKNPREVIEKLKSEGVLIEKENGNIEANYG